MNTISVSSIVFASIFASGLVGMVIKRALPEDRLGSSEKEVARLVTGLMTTTAAIVLGMLVSSAKSSYDARMNEVAAISSEVVMIDQKLARYGTETGDIRSRLRLLVEAGVDRVWAAKAQVDLKPSEAGGGLTYEFEHLAPKNDAQAGAKAQAQQLVLELQETQWLLFLKSQQSGVPLPLLLVLVSWLTLIYCSFGLFARPSSTTVVILIFGALATSTAIFIILELYTPFRGVLAISPRPILESLTQMGR